MRLLPPAALLLLAGPLAAQPAQLSADALARIKGTTAYIKVSVPGGLTSGSGFLVRKDDQFGWVATNDHVIAPSTGRRHGEGTPMSVLKREVVFNSGTPQEWRAAAEVVARDPLRDLACLRFPVPKGKTLPDAVNPAGGAKATETLPVYVCGFPFGGNLAEGDKNPEISIGPASVSSVRSNDAGEVQRVQINGALNPGNSGGPIVAADGRLVGVAVTTISKDGISNAGIGFAVPHHHVKEMMAGRVSEPQLYRAAGGVVAAAVVVDPLNRLKGGKVWLAPVNDPNKKRVDLVRELTGARSLPLTPVPGNSSGLRLVSASMNLGAAAEAWAQSTWDVEGSPSKSVAVRGRVRVGGGPAAVPPGSGGGDDEEPSLPPDSLDGIPGLPPAPAPGQRGPFAGPGGPNAPRGIGPPGAPRPGQPQPGGPPAFGPGRRRPGLGGDAVPPAAPAFPPAPTFPAAPAAPTSPPAEEEEPAVPAAVSPAPAVSRPVMSAPPPTPAVAPAGEGLSTGAFVLGGVMLLAVVVGCGVVGYTVHQAGQKTKGRKKRRPARDWDDDADEDDDRPRRKRR